MTDYGLCPSCGHDHYGPCPPRVEVGAIVTIDDDVYGDLRYEVEGILPSGAVKVIALDPNGKRRKTNRGHFLRRTFEASDLRAAEVRA